MPTNTYCAYEHVLRSLPLRALRPLLAAHTSLPLLLAAHYYRPPATTGRPLLRAAQAETRAAARAARHAKRRSTRVLKMVGIKTAPRGAPKQPKLQSRRVLGARH